MATLEDAAEELVVKLRALDAEIEESDHKLEALRARVEATAREVEQGWTDLTEAATSFLEAVREQGEQLGQQAGETRQALAGAHGALGENATAAQDEIAQAGAGLDALGQRVTSLEPALGSLVAEAGEAPARALAERARELEQELSRLVQEARDFLREDVVPGIEELALVVRGRCEELHRSLPQESTQALQEAYDEWEDGLSDVEGHVLTHGYQASHQHARDTVEYAMDECETGSRAPLEQLQQLVGVLEAQLQEMAAAVQAAGTELAEQKGAELKRELDEARQAAVKAVAGLDRMAQELAQRSFMPA